MGSCLVFNTVCSVVTAEAENLVFFLSSGNVFLAIAILGLSHSWSILELYEYRNV